MASDSLPTPPPATAPPSASPSASGSAPSAADPAPAPAAAQPTPAETLAGLVQQIAASNSPLALVATLRGCAATSEAREAILASTTPAGDPLDVLDAAQHTAGVLFLLSARVAATAPTTAPVPLAYIEDFCRLFDPEQARLAPERVTMLANGIRARAEALGAVKVAVAPLFDLLTRYAPDLAHLTTVHPVFLTVCATAGFFSAALPVLAVPIAQISTALCPDLRYQDHLVYHYTGGVVLAALKRFAEAAEFFELCASAPVAGPSGGGGIARGPSQGPLGMGIGMGMGMGMLPPGPGSSRFFGFGSAEPSVFQVDAAKKLLLVQLILHGKTLPLPKYTHPAVANLKGSAYTAFAKAYPKSEALRAIVSKEGAAFATDENIGLVKQALEKAPRWAIRKLTETYITLSLVEIGRAVGIEGAEEVRRVVVSMIESGEIDASIDAGGSVTFTDDEPAAVSKTEIDRALRAAQEQEEVLRRLEREIGRSREYLQKAVRSRDEGGNGGSWPSIDEELLGGSSQASQWVEESVY
ncbi:hypothetical protein BC834DRAFT_888631 [Gloeopeniophorella convolvens]|nr:hypothetical protein BC834DRAFT_888631 [Gloeopeniophorella convolvens]